MNQKRAGFAVADGEERMENAAGPRFQGQNVKCLL